MFDGPLTLTARARRKPGLPKPGPPDPEKFPLACIRIPSKFYANSAKAGVNITLSRRLPVMNMEKGRMFC